MSEKDLGFSPRVFFSHASEDAGLCQELVRWLEYRRVRCWMAPRDILAGQAYGEQIIQGIEQSSAVILLLSASANRSHFVVREIERAVSLGKLLIPVRLEDVLPSKGLELFVSSSHWISAMRRPLEGTCQVILDALQAMTQGRNAPSDGVEAGPGEAAAGEGNFRDSRNSEVDDVCQYSASGTALNEEIIKGNAAADLAPLPAETTSLATKRAELLATVYDEFSVSTPVAGFGGRPAIAVLPFYNMSNDVDQAYFADGIAEDILIRLAMWRWVPVIAKNSSFAYRDNKIDLNRIGRELGARYLLQGSVRKSGTRVRVTAQLMEAESGINIWAHKYDRTLEDIFTVQDEITDAIVGALEPVVGRAERARASRKATKDLDAWEIYQRAAWHYSNLTRESFVESYRLCLISGGKDPSFSSPLALASTVLRFGFMFGWFEPTERGKECYQLALQSKLRDPLEPLALSAYASVCPAIGRHDEAIEIASHAIQLNPSFSTGHYCLGWICMLNGEVQRAVSEIELSIRLSPQDLMLPQMLATLSSAYYMMSDFGRAKETAALGINSAPQYPMNYRCLANALGELGEIDAGKACLRDFLGLVPTYNPTMARDAAPFRDEADQTRYLAGLRKLGWGNNACT